VGQQNGIRCKVQAKSKQRLIAGNIMYFYPVTDYLIRHWITYLLHCIIRLLFNPLKVLNIGYARHKTRQGNPTAKPQVSEMEKLLVTTKPEGEERAGIKSLSLWSDFWHLKIIE